MSLFEVGSNNKYLMLHIKFQGHWPNIGSAKDDM